MIGRKEQKSESAFWLSMAMISPGLYFCVFIDRPFCCGVLGLLCVFRYLYSSGGFASIMPPGEVSFKTFIYHSYIDKFAIPERIHNAPIAASLTTPRRILDAHQSQAKP